MIPQAKIDKFWSRVDKSGECWLWTGPRNQRGYGVASDVPGHRTAHRTSYAIEHGSIPAGAFVCHHCDNPPCVRPEHLYAGDVQTNSDDAMRRGRMRVATRGRLTAWDNARHPRQLSEEALASLVLWTDARAALGLSRPKLALALGCGLATIANVERGLQIPRSATVKKLAALVAATLSQPPQPACVSSDLGSGHSTYT